MPMILFSKIEGKGEPLVIMHGFLGMSDNWKSLGTKFAGAGFEVHMVDMRNHGRSFHSDEFTYPAMTEDIVQYCAEHNLKNINLLGHSMGGKTAMFIADAYPELVKKLVVADIAPRQYKMHHEDIMRGLNAVDFSTKPSRDEVDEIIAKHVPDFGTRQFLMKSLYWKEPGVLAFRFNLPVFNKSMGNIWEALPETVIETPTLFLKGENSRYISEQDKDDIKRIFPNSTLETIANAGHWLHAENPADFYAAVIAFLK